jgi:GNAT superfamily N-acetyltransferase
MEIVQTQTLSQLQKNEISRLWNAEFPAKISYHSIAELDEYLENSRNPRHYFLLDPHGRTIGWGMDFVREDAPWFVLIINTSFQKKGYGSMLLNRIKSGKTELYGWVTDHNEDLKHDGMPYVSPISFYKKNGFEILPGDRLSTEKISAVKIRWRK